SVPATSTSARLVARYWRRRRGTSTSTAASGAFTWPRPGADACDPEPKSQIHLSLFPRSCVFRLDRRRSAAKLICRGEGDGHRRELRRGRDRSVVSRGVTSNVAAAVHLAAAGQADRSFCAGHTHPGRGTGGAGECVTA